MYPILSPTGVFHEVFRLCWLIGGPLIGALIATKRGIHPVIGIVLGLLGCIGWGLLFLVAAQRPTLNSKPEGALLSFAGPPPQGWQHIRRNVFAVPPELYRGDLPAGFDCTLYIGRMVGKLGAYSNTKTLQKFNYEMYDAEDPTEMVLRDVTYEAPAEELARWENVGDIVGIVIASKGSQMDMVLAYNITRRKWFGTGYYPHARDISPVSKYSVADLESFSRFSFYAIFLCGLGFILIPIAILMGISKTSQFRVLNPAGYRMDTARRIADSITAHSEALCGNGNASLDPSL